MTFLNRLRNFISEMRDDKKTNKKYLLEFENAIKDDLDLPKALQILWNLSKDKKATGKIQTIKKMDEVFSLDLLKKEKIKIPNKIKKLAEERQKARNEKNWKLADELREKINQRGYVIEDTKKDYVLKIKLLTF